MSGQIFSRQRKPAVDEPILYGANTEGMLPIVLHPDEWLDGAIVPSLQSWFGGTETILSKSSRDPGTLPAPSGAGDKLRRDDRHDCRFR
jgi:hypothetical protein